MSKIKRLAGETILYGLGSMLPRFLNFLLVRLHTDEHVFSPDDYGIITKLFAYAAVVNVIFMFGMETAYFRFATRPGADERKIFNLAQTIVIGISLSLSILFILLAQPITEMMYLKGHINFLFWLIGLMFIDAAVAIPFARLRLQKKATLFAVGKLINVFILIGLNIYFLKFAFDPAVGLGYVVLANLTANAFYIIFFAKTLFAWRPRWDRYISPEMFSYAYPVMLTGLAGMTNEMFSRFTLEWWLPENFYPGQTSNYALGIFGASYKFAVFMNLAIQAFRYAAEPFFFSNAADKNSPQLFARVNHYFVIVCCVFLLGVSINLDILKYFLGSEKYWEGLYVVPILLLAYLFLGVYYNMSIWFKLSDKTFYGTLITLAGAFITIGANYLLIPKLGYLGSSWAALVCYFSMAVICYLLGQKHYPIPYGIGKSLAYILSTILLVYAVNYFHFQNIWLSVVFHGLIIGMYLLGVYALEKTAFRTPAT
jgi:O-antigen/teichoic acid export membrane protein